MKPSPVPPVQPVTPTNLRATTITASRVDLVWESGLALATAVERSDNGSAFLRLATVPAGTLHYSNTSLRKNHAYVFRVGWVGYSGYSNTVYVQNR